MPKRLSDIERERAEEVAAFWAAHPELMEAGERAEHERRWVVDRNLTTYPIDPHTLNEMDLGTPLGVRSTMSHQASQNGEFEEGNTGFRTLFPPADPRTSEQEAMADAVEAAFQRMRPQDVELLEARYVELRTLDSIAAAEGVTRQAIIKRLATAEKHMREALDALD